MSNVLHELKAAVALELILLQRASNSEWTESERAIQGLVQAAKRLLDTSQKLLGETERRRALMEHSDCQYPPRDE